MSFTRKQAAALIEWGRSDPRVTEAYENPNHPGHEEAVRFADRLLAIAHAPGGADDAGEPIFDAETFMARYAAGEPGACRRLEGIIAGDAAPMPLAKPLPGDDGLADLRSLTPEAAQERITALTANADFDELLTKEKDPVAVAAWDLLNAIVAGVASQPDASPGGAAPSSTAQAQRQLDDIYAAASTDKNHPYANSLHPQHEAMQETVMRLTAAAMGGAEGATPATPGSVTGAGNVATGGGET